MGQVRGLFGTANNVYLFLIEEIDSAAALNTSVTSLAVFFRFSQQLSIRRHGWCY